MPILLIKWVSLCHNSVSYGFDLNRIFYQNLERTSSELGKSNCRLSQVGGTANMTEDKTTAPDSLQRLGHCQEET